MNGDNAHPDSDDHFDDCITCHRRKYGRPGMTAGEFSQYLPEHLGELYWRQKIREVFVMESRSDPFEGEPWPEWGLPYATLVDEQAPTQGASR